MGKNKTKTIALYVFYAVVLLLPCLEIALRIVGAKPYKNSDYKVSAIPENPFVGDSLLGLKLNSGNYQITLNDKITFSATHLENGQRKTTNNIIDTITKTKLAVFGCSFTYGYGVADDETFCSILQNSFPAVEVENHAVPGYGTVQSYLQMKRLFLQEQSPELVMLVFSGHHLERNVLSPSYRSALKIGFDRSNSNNNKTLSHSQFPFVTRDTSMTIQWEKWDEMYDNWTGRETFASINWLQSFSDNAGNKNSGSILATLKVFLAIKQLCYSHDTPFLLVYLDDKNGALLLQKTTKELEFLQTCVHFNFDDKSLTNLPYDSHPNSLGHQYISSKIFPFISNSILK